MIFNDWLEYNYPIDDTITSDFKKIMLKDKYQYLDELDNRGWIPFAIVQIGVDAWMKLGEIEKESDPFAVSPTMIQWCTDNCKGRWLARDPIWWEIELEEDALAFKLVWG